MAPSLRTCLQCLILAPFTVIAQSSTAHTASSTSTSYRPLFTVPLDATLGATLLPNIYDSAAKDAQNVCHGYKASNVKTSATGLTAQLSMAGAACNVYGTDIETLSLLVEYQTNARLHINIKPSHITSHNQSWYLLPEEYVPAPKQGSGTKSSSDLTFSWSNSPSFGFNVTRASTGDVLFSTTGNKLVFENQFIEFVTEMPENYNLYGLGEVIHGFRLGNNFTRTIYAADVGDPIDQNLYGSHPFYLDTRYYEVDSNGKKTLVTSELNTTTATGNYTSLSHGVYFRNAHGMEVLMNPTNVTWRTIGGVIDLYFYAGPTQPEVTNQHLVVTGMPALQQYWGFGFHQCRWGYENWTVVEEVVDNYAKFGIPLETVWTDIDYMRQYRDFDNDPIRFGYPEGQKLLEKLHSQGQHYIPIVDSAIYVPNGANSSDAYQPFNDGNATGSYLLNPDGSLYIGEVWPGYTVFPDWQTSAAKAWWKNQVVTWHKKIPFDGIWIDMSEVSSFCVGSCGTHNITMNPVHPPFGLGGEKGNIIYDYPEGFNLTNATEASSVSSASSAQSSSNAAATPTPSSTSPTYLRTTPTPGVRNINHPPYVLNHVQGDLAVHAVSPNATHHTGVSEYDVHNLFGHQILQNTYSALLAVNSTTRPFVIGRSTFPGSGTVSGHWGGDNASKWYYMFFSIPQALSFSLFGIPLFGVDTCGFNGNTDEELCNRWMQLSAFFPFYRNHNVLSAIPQEAYVWASVANATKTAMKARFMLLPYMYTLFYNAHTKGDTVMRALAWEFPNDPSLAAADRQFFLGPSILVTPVLDQGASSVNGVFPGLVEGSETYYDWYTHAPITAAAGTGKNVSIAAPLGHIPVYIRGGAVLALQQGAMTTTAARKTAWSVLVAPGVDGKASGQVYLDDGVSITPNETKIVSFTFDAAERSLNATVQGGYTGLDTPLGNVTILDVPGSVTKNGNGEDVVVKINGVRVGEAVVYDGSKKTLVIHGDLLEGAWTGKWQLTY